MNVPTLFPIATVLGSATPVINVCAVGAMFVHDGYEPYDPLVARGLCRIVGFEPVAAECARLNDVRGPTHRYLPYGWPWDHDTASAPKMQKSEPRSAFVDSVLDLLAGWPGVAARRMFGGWGLFRDSVMFAIVVRETLYLRTGPDEQAAFAARGLAPFSYRRAGRDVSLRAYWEAPSELFDDSEEMVAWARRAWTAAIRARQRLGTSGN